MAIFYRRFQQGSESEDAMAYALGHSGLAIVLTSLTTATGLLSFSFAELTAIADIGLFGALGVMLAREMKGYNPASSIASPVPHV